MENDRAARDHRPSPWGQDDRIGAAHYVTAAEVRRALGLVKRGDIVDLSLPIGARSPRIPGINSPFVISMWSHPLVSALVHAQRGTQNGVAFADERIAFDTHTGTHIDALGHTSADGRMYNGVKVEDAATNHGLTDLELDRIVKYSDLMEKFLNQEGNEVFKKTFPNFRITLVCDSVKLDGTHRKAFDGMKTNGLLTHITWNTFLLETRLMHKSFLHEAERLKRETDEA